MKMDDYYKQNDGMLWQDNSCKDGDCFIWRYKNNPIINLKQTKYWHICNSAIVKLNDKYVAIFRVETKDGKPDLVYGESFDGVNFKIGDELNFFYENGTRFECEYSYDPRLVKVGNEYFAIFCADIYGPCIYIAKTTDFKNYQMFPNGFIPGNRNGVLFPELINGMYFMLNRPTNVGQISVGGDIWLSESKDLVYWGNHKLVSKHRDAGHNFWEAVKIGAGPAPIKTDEGWLLIYHGVQKTCNGWTYSMGAMLLDLNDPSKVLFKAKEFLMSPEEDYERIGFTPNVMFPTTALCDSKGHITIYYGVADTNMAIAFTTVEKLLDFVKSRS